MSRIKSGKKKKSTIDPRKPTTEPDGIHFSFKYLDLSREKFSVDASDSQYFIKVLERLQALSSMKAAEIYSDRSSALRAHPINWNETTEKQGFCHLNSQLRGWPAYQFQISSNAHGRVHGFMIGSVFFVAWLDPEHQLYA